MDTVERLSRLKAEVEALRQKKYRAELSAENALRERDEALSVLKDEFGAETIEEANKLLEDMRKNLSHKLEEAEALLGEVS